MILITNLYTFLHAFSTLRVACRNDIYRQSKLAYGTINKCFDASIQGGLIVGAGGNGRTHKYRLIKDGEELLRLLKGMI